MKLYRCKWRDETGKERYTFYFEKEVDALKALPRPASGIRVVEMELEIALGASITWPDDD